MTESGYVPSGEAQIYYETHGSGPAVLFIHAGVADSRMWRDQMGLAGYQSIVFDQRGYGQTEWVAEPYSNRVDALAVLDHLGIDRAVMVGCSNGGEAAMQLALIAPERVSALVLSGAAPRGWEPEGGWDESTWQEALAALQAGDFDRAVDIDAEMWLAGPSRSIHRVDPGLVTLFKEMDAGPTATGAERDQHVTTLEPPTNEQLDRIDVPTLVIVGEHDFPDLHEAAAYLAERLSDRPAVVMEDTAHLPSMERPHEFNTVISGFLAAL